MDRASRVLSGRGRGRNDLGIWMGRAWRLRLVAGSLLCGLDACRQVGNLAGTVRLGAAAEIFLTELGVLMAALFALRGLWDLWRRRFPGKA